MNESDNKEVMIGPHKTHSLKTLAKIQLVFFLSNLEFVLFSQMQFFYTTVVLLPVGLFVVAYLIYTIWNMINDPLLGHLCDKSTRFVEKYGKRFPWIVIGILGHGVALILIFSVPIPDPTINVMAVFIWLLISIIIYDTFYSLYLTNTEALFQDKIRNDDDRRKSGGILLFTATAGLIVATIFQPTIVSFLGTETISSWTVQAIFFAIFFPIILVIMLSGIREGKEMRERRMKIDSEKKMSFFTALKYVLRQRSFVAFIIAYIVYQTAIAVASASLPFFVVYVLGMGYGDILIPQLLMFLAAPISSIVWMKVGNKWGSKKVYTLSFFWMGLSLLPLLWLESYLGLIILMILFGMGVSANGVNQLPIDADVIDEACTITQTRNEGIYNGIQTFFDRLSISGQVLIIGSIQILTGFNPDPNAQTAESLFGIHLMISVFPLIILVAGVILFWILYDITIEKRQQIQAKLLELGL